MHYNPGTFFVTYALPSTLTTNRSCVCRGSLQLHYPPSPPLQLLQTCSTVKKQVKNPNSSKRTHGAELVHGRSFWVPLSKNHLDTMPTANLAKERQEEHLAEICGRDPRCDFTLDKQTKPLILPWCPQGAPRACRGCGVSAALAAPRAPRGSGMHGRTKGSCSRSASEPGETEHLSKGLGRGAREETKHPDQSAAARPPSLMTALRTLFEEPSPSAALPKRRARTESAAREHRASHCRGQRPTHRGSAGRDEGPGQGCHPHTASAPPCSWPGAAAAPATPRPWASLNPGCSGHARSDSGSAAQGLPAPGLPSWHTAALQIQGHRKLTSLFQAGDRQHDS